MLSRIFQHLHYIIQKKIKQTNKSELRIISYVVRSEELSQPTFIPDHIILHIVNKYLRYNEQSICIGVT